MTRQRYATPHPFAGRRLRAIGAACLLIVGVAGCGGDNLSLCDGCSSPTPNPTLTPTPSPTPSCSPGTIGCGTPAPTSTP